MAETAETVTYEAGRLSRSERPQRTTDADRSLSGRRPTTTLDRVPVTLGDVFAPLDALAPARRFALALWLHDGAGITPLRPDEIAVLPIPSAPEQRQRVGRLLRDALNADTLDRLVDKRLADIVPAITSVSGRIDASPSATNRLIALVRSNGDGRWSNLSNQTIGQIQAWRGAGPVLVGRLVAAAVEAAMATSTNQPGAWRQPQLWATRPSNARVHALDDALIKTDPRARAIVEHVDLILPPSTEARCTPPQLATRVGLSYERVRQLRANVLESLREISRTEPLAALAEQLAVELGSATTRGDIERVLVAHDLPRPDDPAGLLAVWLAGPYLPVPGHAEWFSPDPAELVSRTQALLEDGGGVHAMTTLRRDLGTLGITDANLDGWLDVQPLRVVHDVAVIMSGTVAQRVQRALEATGTALTIDDLAAWIEPDQRPGLAATIARDCRFVRTAADRWELSEWGSAPDGSALRLELAVDDDVLIGAEGSLPVTLAHALGLRPGRVSRFATRFGPLALSYDGERAIRGSVRPIALASGAVAGSMLIFSLTPGLERAEVELVAG